MSRISIPSKVIAPEVTSYKRGIRALIVVFPAPDGPTRAVRVPGSAINESDFNTSPLSIVSGLAADSKDASEISFERGYAKPTLSKTMLGFEPT